MLADLLYFFLPYQIFKSVFFRGGLAFLTTYFIVNTAFPFVIRWFRSKGITSDFKKVDSSSGPYQGATPIMGGVVLIPGIVLSVFLWAWMNQFTIALLMIVVAFSTVGWIDDFAKVLHKRRIETGVLEKKAYAEKADGIRGEIRLAIEFGISILVVCVLFWIYQGINGYLHVPMIPLKNWFPQMPTVLFIPFVILLIVGGANAVNFTDGIDTLATIPIITCSLFIAAAAYLAGDLEWSERLKLLYISDDIKEVAVFALAIIAACAAFLRFNSPPASIYMGDVGSLGLGAAVCTMFVFVKAELYLPIVGGTFVLAAISSICQRVWFKLALWTKGRQWAEKNRFFYKAPYHHHQQEMLTYYDHEPEVNSVWHNFLLKIGLAKIKDEDKFRSREQVNNKVIWKNHLRSILLLVVAAMIYLKVR